MRKPQPRVEELDLECPVFNLTGLPDELIEPRLANLRGAVRRGIDPAIMTGRHAVQPHSKANRPAALHSTQCHVQVARMKTEDNVAEACLQYRVLCADIPRTTQPPSIQ
jgi:hypothetical protein